MPELPEVEVICRGIRPFLTGKAIKEIVLSDKKLRHSVSIADMKRELLGNTIVTVERRAKYLLCHLDSSALLIFHFGMTGNLGIFPLDSPIAKHDHLRIELHNSTELRFNDTRRFGSIHLLKPEETVDLENTFFKTTGPEPFDASFNGEYLLNHAKKKTQPLKTFIMTNATVAGIGNIYANESLFAARLNPLRKVSEISLGEWNTLVKEIRRVLQHAIACGGSTISDFVNASQESGYFQMNFKIYGKDGEKCSICSSIIQKQVVGGRASFYCSTCQG